ncbi:lytic transglycosylase domain-containing protein [Rugosimonospora africana]|nr:lytic transglycosylase domain-containing protein [Rugosimonospora africana]
MISGAVAGVLVVAGTVLVLHEGSGKPGPAPAAVSLADRTDADRVSRDLVRTDPSSASPSPVPSSASPSPSSPSPSPTHASPRPTHKVTPTHAATTKAPTPTGCTHYSGNQLTACKLLPSFGFSTSEMSALVPMWNKESSWNVSAENPGSGAYGIPQALPGDKMASVASDWRTNAATQIKWGLGYIKDRYGTPSDAWAFWQANGWY